LFVARQKQDSELVAPGNHPPRPTRAELLRNAESLVPRFRAAQDEAIPQIGTIQITFMKALLESLKPGDRDRDLVQSLDPERLPRHIAIIMDGNGRWAKKRSLPRIAGHKAGVAPVRMAVETCAQLGVEALTLYAFSAENWKRPRTEVDMLWRLLRFYLRRELADLDRNGIRLQASGRIEALPVRVQEELAFVEEATAKNTGLRLNLAINYSGRAEIVDAVNAILQRARLEGTLATLRIDEQTVSRNLYSPDLPDPDLLIRTSGEMRISNFLLWEIAYAELFVTDTFWPDFNRAELLRAILDYQKRDRRFGGLSANATPDESKFDLPDFNILDSENENEAASEEIAVSSQ
jgi:undecaprenyl diphosphate synthase